MYQISHKQIQDGNNNYEREAKNEEIIITKKD